MNIAPAPELLALMSVAPEFFFFMAQAQLRPLLFSHINILIVLVCITLNEK